LPSRDQAAKITINLLGNFEALRSDVTKLNVRGARSRALLACLACEEPDSWTRDQLAALLWEGRDSAHAQSSLRQELVRLRSDLGRTLASDWISGPNIVLPQQLSSDVAKFLLAVREGRTLDATKLYRGELLSGSKLTSKAFQEWLTQKREALRHSALKSYFLFLEAENPNENSRKGKTTADRLIALEASSEVGHRWLMKYYAARGQLLPAMEQYQNFAQALKSESGLSPSPAMQTLFEEIVISARRTVDTANTWQNRNGDWISHINRQHFVAAAPRPRPLLPIHGRPSLAILPFIDNSRRARAQPAIADGLTEELTTALSRIPGLFVSARQSSMVYKHAPIDIRRIASELGVGYLLEGSLEVQDKRMRVHARLINGETGLHLWASSCEKQLGRFFDVRDEIVSEVARQLQPALMSAEIQAALAAPPGNLSAWSHLQRANGHVLFQRHREGLSDAIGELKAALKLDPHYAMAQALLSAVYTWRSTWTTSAQASQERSLAVSLAEVAHKSEPRNSFVLAHCGETALYASGDIDWALELFDQTVSASPGDAHGLAMLANARRFAGEDAEQSLSLIEDAKRISPRDPRSHRWMHYAGWCHWKLGDLKNMEAASREAVELYSDAPAQWLELTCALGLQNRIAESRETAAVLKQLAPHFVPQSFFALARRFYGKRFTSDIESDYRQLCATLEEAIDPD
jgi:TolB-like protein